MTRSPPSRPLRSVWPRASEMARRAGAVWAAVSLAGCSGGTDPAAEMQRAIRGAEHALDASLLGTEILWWSDAPPTVTQRHGETCGCPCRERVGSGGSELVLLDYALDGCVPDSGLLPDELLGHITLVADGTGRLAMADALAWEGADGSGRSALTTDVTGRWRGDVLTLAGSVVWNGTWADMDLRVTRDDEAILLTGTVKGPEAWVDFEAVQLRYGDLRGRCPRATGGTVRVWAHGEPVRLAPSTDGQVVASWKGESSLPTDPCDVQ